MDRLLENNKVVLLIALVLSLLLWFSVRGAPSTDGGTVSAAAAAISLDQPVTVINVSDEVTVANTHPLVTLTLRGDRLSLMQARWSASSIHCTADLQGIHAAGSYPIPVKVTGLPDNVKADPAIVSIQLLSNISKNMNVSITPEGNVADGYSVGNMKIDPPAVTIKGPEQAVNSVTKVFATLPLQKSDTGSLTRTVLLHAVNDIGQPVDQVHVQPPTVNVTLQVTKPTQTLPVKVQTDGSPKQGFVIDSITTSPATVEVLGNISTLDAYPLPAIDVSGISQDKTYSVNVPTIAGVTQVSPSVVAVTVHVAPAQSKTLSGIPITLSEVPKGYTATLSTPKIDVVVVANQTGVASVQASDIVLTADLSTISPTASPTTVSVPIHVKGPNGVQIQLPGGTSTNVTLTKT